MFGAKTPFGASSTFGTGTSAFGAQATASPFGQTAASGTSGGLFGSTNTQPGFGTFGSAQQPSTGLFGATATNTAATGLFGAGTNTGSLFGQPAASTRNVFGTPASTASTGLFGGGAATGTQSTMFNSSTGFQSTGFGATQGTQGTPVKFAVVSGSDQMVKNGITTSVNTRHQCITVMKEYESKSFEELRSEDYTLGRKTGPTAGTTTATTSANTGGLFGSSTPGFSAFAQPKTGFGTTTGASLFGQNTQQPTAGGLFGSKPGGLFGTNTATTSASTGFGSTFGSTPATGGLFGQTSTAGQTGGLFGATATTQAPGGLFGTTSTGFGQSNTTGTGLFGQSSFGNTQQNTGLFNKLGTGTTFGAASTGGLFASQNKPATATFGGFGSGFGTATNNSSLFGKPAFGTTNTAGTSFGTGTAGSSLFGTGTNTALNTTGTTLGTGLGIPTGFGTGFGQTGTSLTLGTSTLLGSQNTNTLGLAQQQQQQQLLLNQQILALNNSPFGDSKLFRNTLADKPAKAVTSTTTSKQNVLGTPSHYKVSSKLAAKIKPRPINNHTMNKSKLFEGLDDDIGLSPDTFVPRKSIKKLIIKKRTTDDQDFPVGSELQTRIQNTAESSSLNESDHTSSPMGVRFSTGTRRTNIASTNVGTVDDNLADEEPNDDALETTRLEPCGIVLARPEYYTIPCINELNDMVDSNGEVWVNDFVVGREGYGQAKFLGRIDVADLNLDEIVFFRRREIEVYPEGFPRKPPVGQGLNRKSEITLINVWPNDKSTHKPIKSPERLRLQHWMDKVEAATAKLDAVFVDYRPETGTWVFVVEHFTKYGIHEFLEAEDITKKPMKSLGHISKTQEFQKTTIIDEEEKMLISKSLHDQQAKIAAYEQEKEKAATESMQDQDSDIDDLDQITFPEEEPIDEDQYDEPPASHQQASALGVSAHRMQVMKASFFGESQQSLPPTKPPVNTDTRKSTSQRVSMLSHASSHDSSMFGRPKRVSDVIGNTALMPRTMASSSPSSRIMEPSAIGSALDRGTKLVGARAHQRQLVPKDKSITNSKEHFVGDQGLVMGRSFRVGWGPGFLFVHSGNPKGQMSDKTSTVVMSSVTEDVLLPKSRHVQEAKEGLSPFGVVKERVNIASHLTKENESALMQHVMGLEVELEHSISSSQHGCPLFEPSPGIKGLHHHADICKKNMESVGRLNRPFATRDPTPFRPSSCVKMNIRNEKSKRPITMPS